MYVAELARRVKTSSHGVRLESGVIVGILLFADDIILIANTPEGLEALKGILEIWCSNYKMMESVAKTNIISLDESYRYLRVKQYPETHRTSHHKGEDILKRSKTYKNVELSCKKFLPDKVKSPSTFNNLEFSNTARHTLFNRRNSDIR